MANSTVNVYGTTKGASETFANNAGQEIQLLFNPRGDLLSSAALPPKTELVRMGKTWTMRTATASAFTYVAALPTTLAVAMLYNGEASGGKSYVIDSAWLYGVTSMAASQPVALIGQLVPASTMVAPTHSATTTLISSNSGKGTYDGLAKRAINVTTAFGDLWQVLCQGLVPSPTTNLGASLYADLFGGFIVPPGAGFGLNAVAGTAVGTAIVGLTWHEVVLTLG
mgnify:CR=1 FL=1